MGTSTQKRWTNDEDIILRDHWFSGKRKKAIGTAMGRTASSIASRAKVLGLAGVIKQNRVEPDSTNLERVNNTADDIAFQNAMRAAIAAGLEHAPIGVVKDSRPPKPTFYPTRVAFHGSGCSSPANVCAELG
jgi:hypothetical protein